MSRPKKRATFKSVKKLTSPILLIGSSREASDVRYATGFTPLDPVVYLQHARKRFLVVPALEMGRAKQTARGVTVLTPSELNLSAKERRKVSAWVWGLLKRHQLKRVVVSSTFPLGIADALKKREIRVQWSAESLFPQRVVKSKQEQALIRRCQRAAVHAMKAAIALIRSAEIGRLGYLLVNGHRLTSENVRLLIETTLLEHDTYCGDVIVACGPQAAEPHERGYGPLRAHQPIVLDIFPQHRPSGYWGDITRTVVRGTPGQALHRMYRAVRAAHAAALREVRSGVKTSKIHDRVKRSFETRGFETRMSEGQAEGFIHSTGHGIGLDIHEAPTLSTGNERLRSGHVVTVEPGLYYPRLGGIRIEDTVVVTRTGYRLLAACPKRFEV